MKPKDRLIIALDTKDIASAERILDETSEFCNIFKIGPGLFIKEGRDIVKAVKKRGKKCFLDLKLFDIPNTVLSALESAASLDVDIITLHILGGERMLKVARAANLRPETLLGVTILTSVDEKDIKRLGMKSLKETVIELAKIGKGCGLSGVVCSGLESSQIKEVLGEGFLTVVPGIRIEKTADDQKRTVLPEEAIMNGADFIVVGRPILKADSPRKVASEIIRRMGECLAIPK
ncbi:orotidine-5'-phosphate decarboxylase [bacterium]|nr:orotidine-5'-phosphate decarboxylase [bacterium]